MARNYKRIGDSSKLILEVLDLLDQGTLVTEAIQKVAQTHHVNKAGLGSICYHNAQFRQRQGLHLMEEGTADKESSRRKKVRSLPQPPAGAPEFMSEFFRYLSDLQEKADMFASLKKENESLKNELEAAGIKLGELQKKVDRLVVELERVNFSKQDHYSGIMEKARQQFIDGQPN